MKLKPNETKKHHFVAQCLQREFASNLDKTEIYQFPISCKRHYLLEAAKPCEIETNLQLENLFTLQMLENSQQVNLESVFGVLENQFARNVLKLNSTKLEQAKAQDLEQILKNLLAYFFLDYMRSPHRKAEILRGFLQLPESVQHMVFDKLEHPDLAHTEDYHTKLLALGLLSVNRYSEELGNFISGTGAWLSTTLFVYDDQTLLHGGIALSDMSILSNTMEDGNYIYVNALSKNKFMVTMFDKEKLNLINYSRKRRSKPIVQTRFNDLDMLANYNKLTVTLSKGFVYSNSKVIYGVKNIN
nr:DUF4238 domain-containing protein [Vibrio jasicida]